MRILTMTRTELYEKLLPGILDNAVDMDKLSDSDPDNRQEIEANIRQKYPEVEDLVICCSHLSWDVESFICYSIEQITGIELNDSKIPGAHGWDT